MDDVHFDSSCLLTRTSFTMSTNIDYFKEVYCFVRIDQTTFLRYQSSSGLFDLIGAP